MLLLSLATAHASCPEEAPSLALGARMWVIEGGQWTTPTQTVTFTDGLAFSVTRNGTDIGVVAVGHSTSHMADDGRLIPALRRELELTVPDGTAWDTPVDVAWKLGSTSVPANWTPLRWEGNGAYGTDELGHTMLMVF